MWFFLPLLALATPPTDLTALGIVVSGQPDRSAAILRSGGKTRLVAVGGLAFGGRVVAIGPAAVSLDFDGEKMEVRLSHAPELERTLASPTGGRPEDPAKTMARDEVERRLGQEMTRILAETALTPATEGDHVAGFTLTRVPAGTLLTDAGLQAGDVLTRINDIPIDSFATLMGLWPKLQGASEIRAVVLRGGQPVSLTVRLR